MESGRFDDVVKSVAVVSSRRDVVRWLAASAMGAALVLGGMQESDARGRNTRKPRKNKVCKDLRSVIVPATGTTVTTPVLLKGKRYRLRASGFWTTNAQFGNDAFAAFPFANPNAPETTFQGVRLGLSVNGGSPDEWGSYNTGHVYEREITGRGEALSLRFTDPQTNDNSGSLTVEIFCA